VSLGGLKTVLGQTASKLTRVWVVVMIVTGMSLAGCASNDNAKKLLLGEKEPSMQFTTPEELGELAVFFCSPAGGNVRGVAWNMDGGWVAQ
jgi:3-hydroxybutyrate dehydrogenase